MPLIENAFESVLEKEGGERLIRITSCQVDKAIRIQISDNGNGFEEDDMHKIFAHGYTTKKGGNGFGLHFAAIAAKELNGTIEAGPGINGTGASFTVTLNPDAPEEPRHLVDPQRSPE